MHVYCTRTDVLVLESGDQFLLSPHGSSCRLIFFFTRRRVGQISRGSSLTPSAPSMITETSMILKGAGIHEVRTDP